MKRSSREPGNAAQTHFENEVDVAGHSRLRVIVHGHRTGKHVRDPGALESSRNIPEHIQFVLHRRRKVLFWRVDCGAFFHELGAFLFQAAFEGFLVGEALFGGVFADVFGDFHAAEVRAAHAAKVGGFGAFLGEGFVVEFAGAIGIEAEVELVFPAEFEAGFAEGVVAKLRAGMALGEVGGVRGDAIGDDAFFHILFVGQAEVFLGSDVAEHGAAKPANHGGANAAGDVVVTGRDVGRKGTQRVEGRFVAMLQLEVHVLFDEVHGDVAGAFDHDLDVVFPGDLRQFTERFEFGELGFVVRVRDCTGTKAVTEAEADEGRHRG